jgi:hypothetical protein
LSCNNVITMQSRCIHAAIALQPRCNQVTTRQSHCNQVTTRQWHCNQDLANLQPSYFNAIKLWLSCNNVITMQSRCDRAAIKLFLFSKHGISMQPSGKKIVQSGPMSAWLFPHYLNFDN